VPGEINTFLFLRTLTDSGLSELEVSDSFSYFLKILTISFEVFEVDVEF